MEKEMKMASLTIRMPDDEKDLIRDFARFNGKSVSTTIRDIVLERLEDEYDMKVAREYERGKEHTTYAWKDVNKELGL
jgi:predicted DNA-binding protein